MKYLFLFFSLLSFHSIQAQSTDEINWLNHRILPIQAVKAGSGFDLAAVGDLVGEATIVALGKSTHGSREMFRMKHRLLEYLVTQKGFTIFAMEADFSFQ